MKLTATSLVSVRPSQTKIVATLGPASDALEKIRELVQAGVDVFRLNAAHGSLAEHDGRLQRIRQVERELGVPIGVLLDLAGPKIRLGELWGGELNCGAGKRVRFVRYERPSTPEELPSTYERLVDELDVGDRVLLADGTVALRVIQKTAEAAECEVIQPGVIRSRQGINLPGVKLGVEALTEADRRVVSWVLEREIDFLGLSFVRSAHDVCQLRELIQAAAYCPGIVAKIEKPEAVEHLEEIAAVSDAVMVARGDLGVEIDIAQVPMVQKHIIQLCNRMGKPVIVATQMLDSMQHSRLPTRAEVTDVANAILDGTDACMLSGETAVGEYPVETVDVMHRIASATEDRLRVSPQKTWQPSDAEGQEITLTVVKHAGQIATDLQAKLLLTVTHSGQTGLWISKTRSPVLTIGVSDSFQTLRRMALYWGIVSLPGAPIEDSKTLLEFVLNWGCKQQLIQTGDRVVFLFGTGMAPSAHNTLAVYVVP